MKASYNRPITEHPMDVMDHARIWIYDKKLAALVVVMATEGGGVRAPGAMMAVREDGEVFGYVSGGCVDEDIALQAKAAILDNAPRRLRYGSGSPFMDIRLPCGGAIDLLVLPMRDPEPLNAAAGALYNRKSVTLKIDENGLRNAEAGDTGEGIFAYRPKLRLRVAGRGEDPKALIGLATAAGIETWIQSPDIGFMHECARAGADTLHVLVTPDDLPIMMDDAQSAFALMFHDDTWEGPLLEQALTGPAFYIGAVGSRKTHARRCEMLAARGVSDAAIARVRGPIGLVPSMRDASMLAVSALAEIVGAYHSADKA